MTVFSAFGVVFFRGMNPQLGSANPDQLPSQILWKKREGLNVQLLSGFFNQERWIALNIP